MILPPIPAYRDAVLQSVVPAFDDINAKFEAFQQSEFGRLCARPPVGEDDPGALADLARDNAIAFAQTLSGVRQGILNLCAAGLFHLLEQQLAEIWNDAGVLIRGPRVKLVAVANWMNRHAGIDLRAKPYWIDLDTLRLVANTAKHAESAARQLRERSPSLFRDPFSEHLLPGWGLGIRRPLSQPLAGEGLYVTEKEFESLANTAVQCLNDLAEHFEQQGGHTYPDG